VPERHSVALAPRWEGDLAERLRTFGIGMVIVLTRVVLMQLSKAETTQAIKEYLQRRGVEFDDTTPVEIIDNYHNRNVDHFNARVNNVTVPPKEGPYR
jgi:DNA phosphorothioation-dependent restriction protein DptG